MCVLASQIAYMGISVLEYVYSKQHTIRLHTALTFANIYPVALTLVCLTSPWPYIYARDTNGGCPMGVGWLCCWINRNSNHPSYYKPHIQSPDIREELSSVYVLCSTHVGTYVALRIWFWHRTFYTAPAAGWMAVGGHTHKHKCSAALSTSYSRGRGIVERRCIRAFSCILVQLVVACTHIEELGSIFWNLTECYTLYAFWLYSTYTYIYNQIYLP